MQGLGQYVVKVWIISDHMFGNRRAALCTAHGPGDDDWNATGSAQGRAAELTHGREGVVRLGCRRRTRQALPQEEADQAEDLMVAVVTELAQEHILVCRRR